MQLLFAEKLLTKFPRKRTQGRVDSENIYLRVIGTLKYYCDENRKIFNEISGHQGMYFTLKYKKKYHSDQLDKTISLKRLPEGA